VAWANSGKAGQFEPVENKREPLKTPATSRQARSDAFLKIRRAGQFEPVENRREQLTPMQLLDKLEVTPSLK
jgi:hypothetical protein